MIMMCSNLFFLYFSYSRLIHKSNNSINSVYSISWINQFQIKLSYHLLVDVDEHNKPKHEIEMIMTRSLKQTLISFFIIYPAAAAAASPKTHRTIISSSSSYDNHRPNYRWEFGGATKKKIVNVFYSLFLSLFLNLLLIHSSRCN